MIGVSFANGGYMVVANAFIFSLVPTGVIILVSKMKGASPTTMIMAGIAVMYIFNACTSLIKMYANPDALSSLFQWTVGSLDGTRWEDVMVMMPFVIVGIIAIQLLSRQLNVLMPGDESAKMLGVDADKLRMITIILIALISATVVSFTGLIGFI
jgi:iron complex transport system permease protein